MGYSSDEHARVDSAVRFYTRYKLSVLLTDDLAAVIGSSVYNTVRGDFFAFLPEEIHHGRFLRSGLHRYLDFYIPTDYFDREERIAPRGLEDVELMTPFRDRNGRINLVHPGDEDRAQIVRLAEKAAQLAQDHPAPEDHAADLLIFSLMIELLDVCARAYLRQKAHPASSCVPAVVSRSLVYINEHSAEAVSLEQLAALSGCSVTYLTRLFKRHTGKTPHGYLLEQRVAVSQRLLHSGATVTEACYRAGFGDCTNFIRAFRRHTGMTPGQYRKSL